MRDAQAIRKAIPVGGVVVLEHFDEAIKSIHCLLRRSA
jgi:hypothetical protein